MGERLKNIHGHIYRQFGIINEIPIPNPLYALGNCDDCGCGEMTDTLIKINDLYVNAGEIASFKFKREVTQPSLGSAGERFTIRFFLKNGRDMESKIMTPEEKLKVEAFIGQAFNVLPWLGEVPIMLRELKPSSVPVHPDRIGAPDY